MSSLAVITLPSVTGLPKDSFVNTWALGGVGPDDTGAQLDAVTAALAAIYVGNGGHFSTAVSRAANACSIKLYDITNKLDGAPHGSPYRLGFFGMPAAAAGVDYPSEVALAMTLEGTGRAGAQVELGGNPNAVPPIKATRPKGRRTGRIFFGPLRSTVGDGGSPVRPAAAVTAAFRASINQAADDINAIKAINRLGVWSRSDAVIYGLANVSSDNAFDTQRRRGEASTLRTRAVVDVALAA